MPERVHLPHIEPCPFLPAAELPMSAAAMKHCGANRGKQFYLLALQCAQSLWRQGLPAQSLLLMNRAFGADHESDLSMCEAYPLPYAAAAWVMQQRTEDQFIGNPRRHFQHLATRMVPPRKVTRSWRAWACWKLACEIFPDYPADRKQIEEEAIVEPQSLEIFENLVAHGIRGEAQLWNSVLDSLPK